VTVIVGYMLILLVVCQAILVLFKPQTGALSHIMTTEWAGTASGQGKQGYRLTMLAKAEN
jgi:hypothetical protein